MSSEAQTLLLYNPLSGGGRAGPLACWLSSRLADVGLVIEALEFGQLGSQIERARRFTKVLVLGGDGTFSRIAAHIDAEFPPLGILPLGTGNDLARHLGILRMIRVHGWESSVRKILQFSPRFLQKWKFVANHGEWNFFNYLSFGLDAEVVEALQRRRTKSGAVLSRLQPVRNRIWYTLNGVQAFRFSPCYSATIFANNSRTYVEGKTILVSAINSYCGGGYLQDITPEQLNLVSLSSPLHYLRLFPPVRKIWPIHSPSVCASRLQVTFTAPISLFQFDGEIQRTEPFQDGLLVTGGRIRVLSCSNPSVSVSSDGS
jgi:diacylglycerol kinase family enzyme